MARESKTTIDDIARAVGVSKTTISRYINGHGEMMSEKTRERVRAAIELTNYQPSDIARNLKRKKTNLIGVLISDMSTPFSSALIIAIGDYLAERGYVPIFANCDDSLQKEEELIDMLISKGVAGLLVNTTSSQNNHLIGVASRGLPVVLCDRYISNYRFNIVTIEQEKPFHDLVVHLKEQGYTRPVLFTQRWEKNSTRQRRKDAFIAAVKEIYGYDPGDDVFVVSTKLGITASMQLDELCCRLRPGDVPAVIGGNSVTTVQAYKAIHSRGLSMPEEIGLCGPEDWNWQQEMSWATLVEPNITTIYVPARDIGTHAARLLVENIETENAEPTELMLGCRLSIRRSTTRLSGEIKKDDTQ